MQSNKSVENHLEHEVNQRQKKIFLKNNGSDNIKFKLKKKPDVDLKLTIVQGVIGPKQIITIIYSIRQPTTVIKCVNQSSQSSFDIRLIDDSFNTRQSEVNQVPRAQQPTNVSEVQQSADEISTSQKIKNVQTQNKQLQEKLNKLKIDKNSFAIILMITFFGSIIIGSWLKQSK